MKDYMADTVKVKNLTGYSIGLRLINGIERNIAPGTIIYIPRDDLEYNISIARSLFEAPKQLEIEDQETNEAAGLSYGEEDVVCGDEEIAKKLKGGNAALKKWISEISQPHILEKIYHMANELDLPVSKMKILKEKMPEHYLDDEA